MKTEELGSCVGGSEATQGSQDWRKGQQVFGYPGRFGRSQCFVAFLIRNVMNQGRSGWHFCVKLSNFFVDDLMSLNMHALPKENHEECFPQTKPKK